ncbi:hypothetical protein [Mycobacterium vicinigordonae]|uniref:Uncharacterized protein n=1 Tax=Mycobacterium vicinigordonae TaxID=1719132 RepID=A0A7D6DXE4_9MYCO|nr:hypothetical protein [Mycobacterium vicinigordonae]QLL06229.1 hypothetical protein H0P51_21040 [Mycobacterium vicinigordonae]
MSLLQQSRIGAMLPMLNQTYEWYAEFTVLADDLGSDSARDYEFVRERFVTHVLNAGATNRIQLAAAIAEAAPAHCLRSPMRRWRSSPSMDSVRTFGLAGTPVRRASDESPTTAGLPNIVLQTPTPTCLERPGDQRGRLMVDCPPPRLGDRETAS